VFFLVDLEEWLSIEVRAETLIEHPTINKLARHLATNGVADAVPARQQS
jgi:acyl carrier protein